MNAQTTNRTRVSGRLLALGLAAALIVQAGPGSAEAEVLTWTTSGGSWQIETYWDGATPQRAPLSTDDAIIDNGGNAAVRSSATNQANILYLGNTSSGTGRLAWRTAGSAGDMHIHDDLHVGNQGTGYVDLELASAAGKTLTVDDWMYVGTSGSAKGYVTHEAGTVHVLERLIIGNGSSTQGTYTISGDAELTIDGGSGQRYLMVGTSGTGKFYQNGGTVTVGSYLRIGEGGASHGLYTMTDGILDVSDGRSIILGRHNDGTFIQSGGDVHGPTGEQGIYLGFDGNGVGEWQLSGDGTLNSGRFLHVGRLGEGIFTQTGGSVEVPTDAVLGYSSGSEGTYTISDGTLDVDATLRVGNSGTGLMKIIGDQASIEVDGYSQTAASTLELDINGISPINVDGTIVLDGLLDLEFLVAPEMGDQFTLFVNDGSDAVSGNFIGMPEGSIFTPAGGDTTVLLTYQANVDAGSVGNDVALTVVPEPSTLILAMLGFLGPGLFARRRRRRS